MDAVADRPTETTLPPALAAKLQELAGRHAELQEQLQDPDVLADGEKLVALSRESGKLAGVAESWRQYEARTAELADLQQMAAGDDAEMAELAAGEIEAATAALAGLVEGLKDDFLKAEDAGVERFFLELRAGTGGDEAALFVGDLFQMYKTYCEANGWKLTVDDFSESDRGGFKELIASVDGAEAYAHLKYEGGGHRVQRVPETETQGRVHTSAATVAVMPELPDVEVQIDPKDIEEGGCRGGGPGGQNVNKVETGWRISHKPSGLQFKITEQKSQGQNKLRAWALLRAALFERANAKQHAEQTASRRAMMGSGDRSQRVRTYNFPQNRCTDHRLGGAATNDDAESTKNFNLDKIIAGDLSHLVTALRDLDKQERLATL